MTGSGGVVGDGDAPGSGGTVGDGDSGDGDGEPIMKPAEFFAGDDSNRNRVTPGQICERLSTIQCAAEAFCCDSLTRSEASCKSTMLAGCTNDLLLDEVAMDPVVGFDPDHAFAAFTKFEEMAASCDPAIAAFGASRDGLLGMQKGTLGAGANCEPPSTIPSDAEAGAALASCLNPATHACYPRQRDPRNPLGIDWTCEPRSGAGGDCFADSNCNDGLFCDNPDFAVKGDQCEARRANGMPCTVGTNCASLTCKSGSCVEANAQTAYCLQ